ncbi:MAG: UDP-N-acetylglucosamine 1-carboxyvinyltransferase [Candidatus Kerfeldbacteria bacterium]|nr:UDP-N-acetylglucosamine 1-carboxyvinyltransferase [Candidatus Kerfeldbacteria bacterium]
MDTFTIEGGQALNGTLAISGCKNAATPILAATLLTDEPCVVRNVPVVADVARLLDLLRSLGASVAQDGTTVTITAKNIRLESVDEKTVQSMRSSILLLGPLLARVHEVRMPQPGGCIIGNRPIDYHLMAFEQLGATATQDVRLIHLRAAQLRAAHVVFPNFSVTATENVLMAAATAPGTSVIDIAAAEPHVQDLCHFLIAMGAQISGIGTHQLTVTGVAKLHGAEYTIIPDPIEAGTFAIAAATTRGKVRLRGVVPDHLNLVLFTLRQAGVNLTVEGHDLVIQPSAKLRAFKFQSMPYPGLPTDLQAPFGVLATQAEGTSMIHDPIYEGRMGYIQELIRLGANAVVCDPHRVLITGPTPLYGEHIRSFDLRAGATLIIAGLIAQGQTIIDDAQTVDRGYERIEERLRLLGARITRQTV